MPEATLVDRWISRAKNHPAVATLVVFGILVGAVASFTESLSKIRATLSTGGPEASSLIVPPQPQPQPQAPQAKRVSFKESFELGERGVFVSSQGVTIATNFIMIPEGEGIVAEVGAAASGSVEWFSRIRTGDRIDLSRDDCDDLAVIITDIQFSWPPEFTLEQLQRLGPIAEVLINRKVLGAVVGRCEE